MTLDSKLHVSRGQRSMKRSSTAIKTMRKTLASNLSKSKPSTKGAHNRPFASFCKHKIMHRECVGALLPPHKCIPSAIHLKCSCSLA